MYQSEQIYTLQVTALSSSQNGANTAWTTCISLNDAVVAHDVALIDPYNEFEAAECRWYLEDFAAVSPDQTGRGKMAAADIDRYGRSLERQLQLGKLLDDGLKKRKASDVVIEIVVQDGGDSSNRSNSCSIHRLYWECLENPDYWITSTPMRKIIVRRQIHQADQNAGDPETPNEMKRLGHFLFF